MKQKRYSKFTCLVAGLVMVICVVGLLSIGRAEAISFEPSIRIDRRSGIGGDVAALGSMAIDGKGNIYVVYFNASATYFIRSTDGGTTFEAKDTFIGDGPYARVAADTNGHVYVTWDQGGYCFRRSSDGGVTFQEPQTVGGNCSVGVFAADDTGRVYTVGGAGSTFVVHVSHDFAETFTVHRDVGGNSGGFNLAADEEGHVYLVYYNPSSGDPNIYFIRSSDSGDTWSTPQVLGQLGSGAIGWWRGAFVAAIADRVYVAWAKGGDQFDVLLRTSADHGATFGPEVSVVGGIPQQTVVDPMDVAVGGEGNTVYVAWSTRGLADPAKLWLAQSQDGGESFGSPVRVDDNQSDTDVIWVGVTARNIATKAGQIYVSWSVLSTDTGSWQTRFTRSTNVTSVSVDIKPGSFPNSINPRNKGVIPVAILTTDTFDATTVDPLSVKFGPDGATEAHGRGHRADVNRDGKKDLVLHFRTQDTGIVCGDTSASLTGETFSGQAIEGSDSIRTVGCKSK